MLLQNFVEPLRAVLLDRLLQFFFHQMQCFRHLQQSAETSAFEVKDQKSRVYFVFLIDLSRKSAV
jgi:hypothetical protein